MTQISQSFGPSSRRRARAWRAVIWWAAAALAAFVLMTAVPTRAAPANRLMLDSAASASGASSRSAAPDALPGPGPAPTQAPARVPPGALPAAPPAAGLALQVVTPVASCAALTSTALADIGGAGSRITRAVTGTSQGLPACVVEGVLAPSIQFRVELPLGSWTQRYLQVGCGGLCGRIGMEVGAAQGCLTLSQGGFVLASTDMGHQDSDGSFGQDARQREDFAHRAVHLTAVAAKRLLQRFYGRSQRFSYFSGCSDGGREALVEAQRYPDDFDGVLAGAPALAFQVQNSLYHGWQARANTGPQGQAVLTAPRLAVLHQAVLKQCDGLDGQIDGLIADPRLCKFDPASVQCPRDDDKQGLQCLSRSEAETARQLYEGPRDPQTGERLTAGGPQPGSEPAWAGVFVPGTASEPIFSERIALQALRHLVFETDPPPGFTLADLRFDRATFDLLRPRHPLFDATNPDLSRFAARGGKLVLWHGWSDPHISPLNSIAYHQAVRRHMGETAAQAFERLYLLPGVHHCSGGEGPSTIDLLTPLMAWVERGVAPMGVVASTPPPGQRPNGFGQPQGRPAVPPGSGPEGEGRASSARAGGPDDAGPPPHRPALAATVAVVPRTRPVYPYPMRARYKGQGDVNDADSYGPVVGTDIPVPAWAGSDLFQPYPVRSLGKMPPDVQRSASGPAER